MGMDSAMMERAKEMILGITEELELEKTYTGTFARILQFGAFVDLGFGKEGMIHISKLSSKRVEKVEDVVKIGDKVEVKVIKIEKGKVDLKLIGKFE